MAVLRWEWREVRSHWLRLLLRRRRGLAWRMPLIMASAEPGLQTLLRLRLGDLQSQEEYLARFWPDLEREVRRYTRRGGPADELLAEGALALWEAAFAYDPRRHRTPVVDFVTNQVHRRVRQAYRQAMGFRQPPPLPLQNVERLPADPDRFSALETRLDLERAQALLPAPDREVLRHYLPLTPLGPVGAAACLAQRHGGTAAAWRKRLQRTRQRLRRLLGPV